MINKSIIATLLISNLANANNHIENAPISSVDTKKIHTDSTKLIVWNPTITNIKSGESCDDGNCIEDLDCFTKDGAMYKTITSVRDKVKKLCAKL